MSTSNSKSPELPNQTIDVSGSESTANPESFSNKSSKSEQINLTVFEPQMDQLFNIDGMCYINNNRYVIYKHISNRK